MEIRRYQRGEEGALWSVYFAATRESIARDYHAELIERWAPHDHDLDQWIDRLAQKNPFVAVLNKEIVGMAEIDTDGFIDYFYVHPSCQGRGIGKALLATLESEAAELGVSTIFADVSITARSFFVSRGFSITRPNQISSLAIPLRISECKRYWSARSTARRTGASQRQGRLLSVADLAIRTLRRIGNAHVHVLRRHQNRVPR